MLEITIEDISSDGSGVVRNDRNALAYCPEKN